MSLKPMYRLTSLVFKGHNCNAVRNMNGKCVRGRNSNMLVSFDGKKVVVLARMLRKTCSH